MMTKSKITLLVFTLILLSGCGVFSGEPTLTPIYVTATPRIVFVTETPPPGPTSVLAPTLESDATEVALQVSSQIPPTEFVPTRVTNTPTFTPTPTNTPPTPGAPLFQPVGGYLVEQYVVAVGDCSTPPSGGFLTVYESEADIPTTLSCPVGPASNIATAYQTFERGVMIWVSSVGATGQSAIFVLNNNNTYQRFADTWVEGIDPSITGLSPPSSNLQEPIRGFGKIWREAGGVRDSLGWATGNEQAGAGAGQAFERGDMIYINQTNRTYVFSTGSPGTYTSVAIQY